MGEGEPGPLDLLWQSGNSRRGPTGGAQANTDLAGPGDGGADRREIARAAAAERQAGQRPADVGRFGQRRPAIPPQHRIVREQRYRIEPVTDRLRIGERRRQPLGQQPGAARRDGAVDRIDEAPLPLARQRAGDLEIGAARLVDQQMARRHAPSRRFEPRQPTGLGEPHIVEKRPGGGELGPREAAEAVERMHLEMLLEPRLAGRRIEMGRRQRRQRRSGSRQLGGDRSGRSRRVGDNDLAGLEPRHLAWQQGRIDRHDREFACRNVDRGESEQGFRPDLGDGREIIVAVGGKQRVLGERAGGDQPHHLAPHHRLAAALARLGRVLGLLAHRNAVAEPDQLVEIITGRMDRHPAHRNVLAEMLAALGQGDAERPRRRFGIIEEQLVEIPHPVEQQRRRVGRLDLEILGDHRRRALARPRLRSSFLAPLSHAARVKAGRLAPVKPPFTPADAPAGRRARHSGRNSAR